MERERKVEEWQVRVPAERGHLRGFTGSYMRRLRVDNLFLPFMTAILACSVHTGWGETNKANFGCSVINMAATARAALNRLDRLQTGGVLHWKAEWS